jgi:hypothetical protein
MLQETLANDRENAAITGSPDNVRRGAFSLNGNVNKQNFRYWAAENPNMLHQKPLHSEKVTVWCGVSAFGVLWPYFFENATGQLW